jgi:hypothetical protein
MLKNVIIVVLLICCGYLLLRLYAPQYLPGGFGGKATVSEGPRDEPKQAEEAQPAPSKTTEEIQFGSRILRKGMRGPDVALLQERLKLAGFVHQFFTPGVFDEATEQALLAYQKGNDFLVEMYNFRGLPPPPKSYVDGPMAKQLLKVPTPNKALVRYTVEPKENLFRIATKFGIGVESIKYLNNLKDSSALKVGQSLLIICDRSKAM